MRGYDTVEYARSRLVETIIRHEGIPILVTSVGGSDDNIIIIGSDLMGEEASKAYALKDCDINPVELGYVNHKKTSHYIMRTPMRKDWRQGLRMLNIVDVDGGSPRLLPWNVIAETIMGNYPSFKSCLEKLSDKRRPIIASAFCRNFAIGEGHRLWYKGIFNVGTVNAENGNVLIADGMTWVNEAFEESMESV